MKPKNQRTLLIVEDDIELSAIISDALAPLASTILTADNGTTALELIANNHIDAILSDISMPKMDGLKLLEEIRKQEIETPFVVLSGFGDRAKTLEALRLNATDFLDKPFELSVLRDVMEKALELGHAMNEVSSEVDRLYETSNLSPEKLDYAKKAQRAIRIMRRDLAIYNKKT